MTPRKLTRGQKEQKIKPRVTVFLDPEVIEKLDAHVKANGQTKTGFVELLIKQALKINE
jgi:hypothetical protein